MSNMLLPIVSLSPSSVVMLSDSYKQVLPKRPRGQLAALLDAILVNNIHCQANAWKTQKTDDVFGKQHLYFEICFDPPRWSRVFCASLSKNKKQN